MKVGQPLNFMPTTVPNVKMQLQVAWLKLQPGPFSATQTALAFFLACEVFWASVIAAVMLGWESAVFHLTHVQSQLDCLKSGSAALAVRQLALAVVRLMLAATKRVHWQAQVAWLKFGRATF